VREFGRGFPQRRKGAKGEGGEGFSRRHREHGGGEGRAGVRESASARVREGEEEVREFGRGFPQRRKGAKGERGKGASGLKGLKWKGSV